MRHYLLIALAALAAPAMAQEGNAVMSRDDATAAAMRVASFKPADAFDIAPATSELAGRQFSVTYPIVQKDFSEPSRWRVTGNWTYDIQGQLLTIDVSSWTVSYHLVENSRSKYASDRGYFFSEQTKMPATYPANNAFGAQFSVQPYEQVAIVLVHPETQPDPHPEKVAPPVLWERKVPPAEARALVAKLEMRVVGTVSKFSDGGTIKCPTEQQAPTMNKPYEGKTTTCKIAADFTKVELVRADTDEVLATWIALMTGGAPS